MKKLFCLFLILFLGLVPMIIKAQLSFTGELRPRTEYRHGLKKLFNSVDDAAFFTSQRTRLNMKYNNEKFRVGLSVQDVRVWGDVPQLNKSDNEKLMLHEAWGELIFNKNISLKVGRQELVYDDSRILGNVGWAQQARSHDLALFKLKTDENGKFHVGLAVNEDSEALNRSLYNVSYKNMQFAWYNRKLNKFDFSLLFMNVGNQVDNDAGTAEDLETRYNQTFGTHMNYRPCKVSFTGSLYAQTGEHVSGKDISAYMFNLGMKFPVASNWKGNVGIEMLSGTDSNSTGNNESFTPLFGTNHKFNGHMDYFYVGNHVGNVGLTDIYGGLNHSKGQWSFGSTVHLFSSAADLYNGAGEKQDNYLGTELDLSVGYKYSKNVMIKAGYSHMFATGSMEVLKGGDKDETQNWGWVMLVFKPDFLKK